MLRKASSSAHAQTFSQQVNSTMAARGHVQDPNDRRLRPIYGEDSMGSCTAFHVLVFVKGPWDLTLFTLFKVPGVKSRGATMRPHHRRPRSLLPAAPNDSAPYPVCHVARVGHDSHGLPLTAFVFHYHTCSHTWWC